MVEEPSCTGRFGAHSLRTAIAIGDGDAVQKIIDSGGPSFSVCKVLVATMLKINPAESVYCVRGVGATQC
jgi:hypothetical protein